MTTKLLAAAALALSLSFSTVAFAGNPKTDAKADSKTPTKVEAKTATTNDVQAKDQTFTYYVTGKEMVNGELEYTVTTQPQQCSTGADPCKIETDQAADSQNQVPASAITSVLANQSL